MVLQFQTNRELVVSQFCVKKENTLIIGLKSVLDVIPTKDTVLSQLHMEIQEIIL